MKVLGVLHHSLLVPGLLISESLTGCLSFGRTRARKLGSEAQSNVVGTAAGNKHCIYLLKADGRPGNGVIYFMQALIITRSSALLKVVAHGEQTGSFVRQTFSTKSLWCHVTYFSTLVFNSVTPRTVAHQAPLSTGFSRQEYWSGLPRPPPGIFPTRDQIHVFWSLALAGGFFYL